MLERVMTRRRGLASTAINAVKQEDIWQDCQILTKTVLRA